MTGAGGGQSANWDEIRVLHVDDDEEFLDLSATKLSDLSVMDVETVTTTEDGLARLSAERFDCVVADYEMPGRDGIEFLEAVRGDHPNLPFVLFTGKGSEDVASEAIAAGVTDYLQKGSDPSQFEVLANRIENAVERYRAGRAIEETEHRYRRLIEESTDVITVVDAEGRFSYVSPAAERVLGYGADELLGTVGFDYVHPEDRTTAMARFADVVENPGGKVTTEFRFERPDGEWAWLEVRGRNLVEDPVVEGVVVYARDVTDRREREAAIRQERDRFRAVFEESFDAMVLVDDDGRVTDANENAADLFGVATQSLGGRPVSEFVPDASDLGNASFADVGTARGTFPLVRPDDEERTVEYAATADVTPGQHLLVLRDVTQRERYEQSLQDLHDSVDSLLTADTRSAACQTVVDIGKTVLGQPYGSVFLWNDDAGRLEPEAASEESRDAFGPPPTFEPGEGIAGDAYESGESLVFDDAPADPRALDHDDPGPRGYCVIPMEDYGVLIFGSPETGVFDTADVELASILAAHLEVALERTERERTLRDRERTLERQNERLDDFVSVVSHDLRNPLNIAIGALEEVRTECDSGHLDTVATAQARMEALVSDLLTLAREGERVTDPEPVDLTSVVDACWRTVETGDATLRCETAAVVEADRGRLQQLFENLFRNAVEHGGDHVTVSVGPMDDGLFYVADDGPGIPPDEREDVVEFGYSTSPDGTGFGLSIVAEIATAFGWRFEVTESEDGGARFEFSEA